MFIKFITAAAVMVALAIPACSIAQTATPPVPQTQSTGGDVAVCDAGTSTCTPNAIPGTGADATGAGAVAVGPGAGASGTDSTAFGPVAWATGEYSTAVGNNAQSTGYASTATGGGSAALASGATAAGTFALAVGQYATALGFGAEADAANSTAIGANSYADQAGTVSVGSDGANGWAAFQSRIVNMAAGTEPFDAVNLQQLDAGGSAVAAWIGGGAMFDAGGAGAFTAPTFVLANPYTAGSYTTVTDALTALDTAVTDVSKQPGPVGPKGPVGPRGPAGKNGTDGTGTGADPLAVHYDSATEQSITLDPAGTSPTAIHNVATGMADADAVNVDQLNAGIKSANWYTDARVGQLSNRLDYALAASTSTANAAAAVAAQDLRNPNRMALAAGFAQGKAAWTVMYQHRAQSGLTWDASLTGEQGGGSSAEQQIGVGIGYAW